MCKSRLFIERTFQALTAKQIMVMEAVKIKKVIIFVTCIVGLLLLSFIIWAIHGVVTQTYRTDTITVQKTIQVSSTESLQDIHDTLATEFPEYTNGMQLVEVIGIIDSETGFRATKFTYYRHINDSYEGGLVEYYTINTNCSSQIVESVFHFRGAGRAAQIPFDPVEHWILNQNAKDFLDSFDSSPPESYQIRVEIKGSWVQYFKALEDESGL